ncbi:MAG TPA: sugar phosphate isomerase/epimerase family protein [Clostridia bacterium]|nr:sugar phosphate isomerase/epimerase family protein [Clostridia bacterium]
MRFGYCANLNFLLNGDEVSKAVFEAVLESRYDYIEMPLSAMLRISKEQYGDLKKRIEDAGVPCRGNFLLFPHEMTLVGPGLNLEEIREHAKKVLPIAKDLGSEVVIFGNGGSRRVREGMQREAVFAQLSDIVKAVAPLAEEYKVQIAIEPLCSKETNMINTYAEGVALAREAGSAYMGTVCDWYHVATDGQDVAAILGDVDKLFHLHIANPTGRLVPSRRDDPSQYAPFVDAVKRSGYDNKLSIEVGSPGDPSRILETVREGLEAVRALFA